MLILADRRGRKRFSEGMNAWVVVRTESERGVPRAAYHLTDPDEKVPGTFSIHFRSIFDLAPTPAILTVRYFANAVPESIPAGTVA